MNSYMLSLKKLCLQKDLSFSELDKAEDVILIAGNRKGVDPNITENKLFREYIIDLNRTTERLIDKRIRELTEKKNRLLLGRKA